MKNRLNELNIISARDLMKKKFPHAKPKNFKTRALVPVLNFHTDVDYAFLGIPTTGFYFLR
jgi:hypothetical protein